jgi:hypothetical protein
VTIIYLLSYAINHARAQNNHHLVKFEPFPGIGKYHACRQKMNSIVCTQHYLQQTYPLNLFESIKLYEYQQQIQPLQKIKDIEGVTGVFATEVDLMLGED